MKEVSLDLWRSLARITHLTAHVIGFLVGPAELVLPGRTGAQPVARFEPLVGVYPVFGLAILPAIT